MTTGGEAPGSPNAARPLGLNQAGRVGLLAAALALGLSAQSSPQTGPSQGYVATGTATVQDARGTESGSITVEVWGASHCKVTLDLSRPGERPRRWEAVLDGSRAQVQAPHELALALAPPSPLHGCALLPQSAMLATASPEAARSAEAPALSLDPATGMPLSLTWQARTGKVQVSYGSYASAGGIPFPAQVSESVAGVARLTVQFTSLASKSDFTEADFALPPLHAPPTHGYPSSPGGGQ